MNRIQALKQAAFKDRKFDNLMIFNSTNILYLTNFPNATTLHIPAEGESTLYVSSTNYYQAKQECEGFQVEMLKLGENLMEKMAKQTKKPKKIGVDNLGIEGWRSLAKSVGGEEKLELVGDFVKDMRMVKDAQEIECIKQACIYASKGIQSASETIRPGISEQEVAGQVEYAMRKAGSYGTAFETIIASGPNSALSHGDNENRIIQDGDLVVVDLGAKFRFYHSDITRTFVAGKPSIKQRKIFETVKTAQQKAFDAIKIGVPCKAIDEIARHYIDESEFKDCFVHGVGHGIGLEIHEPPRLNSVSNEVLAEGMVISNEPGIYIFGYGGVRIEDTVLITKDGAEKLTVAPYDFYR